MKAVIFPAALLISVALSAQEKFNKCEYARFSPDGKQVLFSSAVYEASTTSGVPAKRLSARIAMMNTDGSGLKYITTETTGMADAHPVMSSDGKKILFRRDKLKDAGEPGDIFIVNMDGTGLKQLSNKAEHETNPEFAMDGKGVIFIREYFTGMGKAKDGELVWIGLDGNGEKIMQPKEMRVLQAIPLGFGRGGYLVACAETGDDDKPLPAGHMLALASPDGEISPKSKMKFLNVPGLQIQDNKKLRIMSIRVVVADGKPVFYVNGRAGEGWFADDMNLKVSGGQTTKLPERGYYSDINLSPDGKLGVIGGDGTASVKLYDFSNDQFSNRRIVVGR